MTPQELLKPRVICTGPDEKHDHYPGSPFYIGQVLSLSKGSGGWEHEWYGHDGKYTMGLSEFQEYPHLFRSLQWWEHRKPEDMPEYVKWTRTQKEGVIQRAEYNIASNTIFLDNHPMTFTMWIAALEPATLEEYNAYLTQKRKEMTPEQKAEELYTPHDNMFMAKRKAFVEGANWQSPTPEAVAVAFGEWIRKYGWYVSEYTGVELWTLVDGDDNYTTCDLFTLFTASPEYKELFK